MSEAWKDTIAGGLAGMAQVVVGQPLDTVKVRLQVVAAGDGAASFRGPMHCIVDTVRQEGFLALYKGMAAPLVGITAVNALLFTVYGSIKTWQVERQHLALHPSQLSIGAIAVAGAGAGVANSVLASPVEMLKVRLQVQRSLQQQQRGEIGQPSSAVTYRGPVDLSRAVLRADGWRYGLMRGFWATVAREAPAYAAFYAAFEASKRWWLARRSDDTLPPWQLMLSGSVAGVSYWCACYPLDVIKSRAQNENIRLPRNYMLRITRQIYQQEGWAGFWRGFSPCVLRSIPAAAVTFTAYELAMRAMQHL